MVVNRNAEHPLGPVLPDDVLVQPSRHLFRRGAAWQVGLLIPAGRALFGDDLLTQANALVADEYPAGAGDETFDSVLCLPAEAAHMLAVGR